MTKLSFNAALKRFQSMYDQNLKLTTGLLVFIALVLSVAVFMFFYTATPDTITISSGPAGSSFQKIAENYRKVLAKEGIKLVVIPSKGSIDNLNQLKNKKRHIDVGFVQSGSINVDANTNTNTNTNTSASAADVNSKDTATKDAGSNEVSNLMSLGSIAYQPLLVFYRGKPKSLLSDFNGMRINIGPMGSGTHALALNLLKFNGIEPGGETRLIDTASEKPVKALLNRQIDALFIMADSTATSLIRDLMQTEDIHLFNFTQADAYARRINYLNKLTLPQGAIDFGKNIPEQDISLVAATVELVARKDLHPALSDALLEAAREVNSKSGLFKKQGEFPSAVAHELPISDDAVRYYATGKSFLYRNFPFWLASIINRTLAVIVPIILLLIPSFRIVPAIYRWRIQSRIYPWYKNLLEIERDAFKHTEDKIQLNQLLEKLDAIEQAVNKIHIPASFGDLFYGLRGHITFVRERILASLAIIEK